MSARSNAATVPAVRRALVGLACVSVIVGVLLQVGVDAHGVSGLDALFLQNLTGAAMGPLMYLGAKHMVTGYDHLAFLVGVIFFLYRVKDVALYVSLFTLGHSLTLLGGVLGGIQVNAYLVDAAIGVSVVYKALDNMNAFPLWMGLRPNPRLAVLAFGLIHGFGLATKLQELSLPSQGLVANIVAFNAGVEVGQAVALMLVMALLMAWRASPGYGRFAFATNTILMSVGLLLMGYQLSGYVLGA
ncbi:MAG: HupE/UreJ family protein [Vicinamibacterales bacterium]